jgi:diacylglycerol kinase family enzyme
MDMDAFARHAGDIVSAKGHTLDARIVEGKDLIAALEQAAQDGDILLAGGGDGTISAAAAVAYQRGIPLAVLPAGTMNLFARSLGVPLDLTQALETLAAGSLGKVDIATANGRPFVHQFGVGLHAKLVKLRASLVYRSRWGKMLASTRSAFGAVLAAPRFWVDIVTAEGIERRRTSGIMVSNNPMPDIGLPFAERLDRGVLGLYAIPPLSPQVGVRLAASVVLGRWKSLPEVLYAEAREVTLRFPGRKASSSAVIDGELIDLPARVDLRIHPGALKVVLPEVPAPADKTAAPVLSST